MTCKFEIQIKNTKRFHCATKFGFRGWAYTWTHSKEMGDPCEGCPIKIIGKPLVVDREVRSSKWGDVAGSRITTKDWDEIHKRGYEIKASGIVKRKTAA